MSLRIYSLPFSTLYCQAPLSSSFQLSSVNREPWLKFRGMGKSEVKVFFLLFPSYGVPLSWPCLITTAHCSTQGGLHYTTLSFKVSTASLSSHHLVSRSGDSAMRSASSSLWFPFATHITVINPHGNKCSLNHPFVSCWDSDKNQDNQRAVCLVKK